MSSFLNELISKWAAKCKKCQNAFVQNIPFCEFWSFGTIKIISGMSKSPRMQILSFVGARSVELWPFYIKIRNYPSVTLTRSFTRASSRILGQTSDFRFHAEFRFRISDFRFRISELGESFQISKRDFGLQIPDFRFQIPDFRFQNSDFRLQISFNF